MRAIGRDPLFIERAEGAEIFDVDGNLYVDYVCSWGPLILGHAHPAVIEAVTRPPRSARRFGAPTAGEVELAELVSQRMPGVDMLRMTSSGTEASMSAIRLARAATGRETLLKFAGAYHGHVDGLLAEAGSGLATQGIPASPGVPEAATARHGHRAVERPRRRPHRAARARVRRAPRRALSRRTWASSRPSPASSSCCASSPPSTARCWSSTRSSPASASPPAARRSCIGVTPDLTVMGKVIGGGLPPRPTAARST